MVWNQITLKTKLLMFPIMKFCVIVVQSTIACRQQVPTYKRITVDIIQSFAMLMRNCYISTWQNKYSRLFEKLVTNPDQVIEIRHIIYAAYNLYVTFSNKYSKHFFQCTYVSKFNFIWQLVGTLPTWNIYVPASLIWGIPAGYAYMWHTI